MVAHVGEHSYFEQPHESVKLPSSICCLSTSRPPEGMIGRFRQLAPPPQTMQDESFRKFKPRCPRCCIRRFLTDCSTPTDRAQARFSASAAHLAPDARLGGLRRLAPTPHADRSRGSLLPSQPAPLLTLRSAASKGHPHPLRQATGKSVSTLVSPSSCRCVSPCYIASRKPPPDSGQSSLLLPAEANPPQASRARVPMQTFNPQPDGAQVPVLVTYPATYPRIHRDHRLFAGPTSSQGRPAPSVLVRDTTKDGCALLVSAALLSKAAHVLSS